MKRCHKVLGVVRALTIVGVLSFAAFPSHATLIGLTLQGNPDIYVINIGINYVAADAKFEAIGSTDTYIDLSDSYNSLGDYPGTYNLTAYITSAGLLTNGTVTIEGDTDFDTFTETLLTGTLNTGVEGTAFGATDVGDGTFEFLFAVTGGDLASVYGGNGATIGVILTPDSGNTFNGTWTSDFSDGGLGYGDNAPVIPEPSSFLLLVLGTALCVATHRRHRHTRAP